MIQTAAGYTFESTGKHLKHCGALGFSVLDNIVRMGYDFEIIEYNDEKECLESDFTEEEKKELAKFVIEEWAKFAGIKVSYE